MAEVSLREWADLAGVSLFEVGLSMGRNLALATQLNELLLEHEQRLATFPDIGIQSGIQHALTGQALVLTRLNQFLQAIGTGVS